MREEFYKLLYRFPKLEIQLERDVPAKIYGAIPVMANGKCYGIFNCTVVLTDYPDSLPTVFENSGLIPKVADRHVNRDGSFCLCVIQEALIYEARKIDINLFFDELLLPYLAAQIYYEREKKWPGGEYSHGIKGVLEFFQERLGFDDEKKIESTIFYFMNNFNIWKNVQCYCGRKKAFVNCCGVNCESLSSIPREKLSKIADICFRAKEG